MMIEGDGIFVTMYLFGLYHIATNICPAFTLTHSLILTYPSIWAQRRKEAVGGFRETARMEPKVPPVYSNPLLTIK